MNEDINKAALLIDPPFVSVVKHAGAEQEFRHLRLLFRYYGYHFRVRS
jgi:hypothetical protein